MGKHKERIVIVGAGNVATAFATLLPQAGYRVSELVARSGAGRKKLARLARKIGARKSALATTEFDGEVIWLAISDSGIESCAAEIAEGRSWKNKIVLHSSGALTSDALQALRNRGAKVASAHPMMTFVAGKIPQLKGVAWTVEGDSKAVAVAAEIVRSLGGTAIRIEGKLKPLYHAFGAFLSPLLVVHLETASTIALKAGIPRKQIAQFMTPILQSTLENLLAHIGEKDGAGKAFSGPLVRGDVATIQRHLDSLRAIPEALRLYRVLLQTAVLGKLPVKNRDRIRALLSGPRRSGRT